MYQAQTGILLIKESSPVRYIVSFIDNHRIDLGGKFLAAEDVVGEVPRQQHFRGNDHNLVSTVYDFL